MSADMFGMALRAKEEQHQTRTVEPGTTVPAEPPGVRLSATVVAHKAAECSTSGGMIARSQAARLADTLEAINSTVCAGYEEECGPLLIHPCTPPGVLACVDGVCTEQAM